MKIDERQAIRASRRKIASAPPLATYIGGGDARQSVRRARRSPDPHTPEPPRQSLASLIARGSRGEGETGEGGGRGEVGSARAPPCRRDIGSTLPASRAYAPYRFAGTFRNGMKKAG